MLNSLSIFLSSEILSYLLRHFDAKYEIPWTCFHYDVDYSLCGGEIRCRTSDGLHVNLDDFLTLGLSAQ